MKKFYFMLVALVCALAANAADWYLVGASFGWADNAKYLMSATDDANVYTITVPSISGEFKIKPKGTWTGAIGGAGDAIKEGVWYQGNTADGGKNLKVSGEIKNATVSVNVSTKQVLVQGEAKANEYTDIYLVGDFGSGWSETVTSRPLKLKEGTTNVYEGTYELTAAKSYFKMKAGSLVYGTGGNDIAVELGKEYTASQSGNAFSIGLGKYVFTFVLDKNAASGKLTVTSDGAIELPENLYVIGNLNNKDFLPNNTVALAGKGDGTYSGEVTLTGTLGTGFSYFQFCSATGSSTSDWAGLGVRYGALTADCAVTLDTPTKLEAGKDKSWKMADGTYIMNVDLNNLEFTMSKKDAPEPPAPVPAATFDFTDYSFLSTYAPGVAPVAEWTADGSTGNTYFDVTELGSPEGITIAFEKTADTANPIRFYRLAAGSIDLRFYKNNTMTITAPANKEFKSIVFATASTNTNINKLAVITEESDPLVNDATAKTMTWTAPAATRAAQSFNQLQFNATGTVRIATIAVELNDVVVGVEGIEADDNAPAEYFNLQGVRVAEPENGLYIKRQGNKVSKVILRK